MPLAYPLVSNFNGGELTPLSYARVDLQKYTTSVQTMQDMVPLIQGGATRRMGTRFVGTTKTTGNVRNVPFVFSDTDAVLLEFGHQYIRFYANREQVLSGGTPYEIATPWTAAEVEDIDFVQSADVMYVVHKSHAIRKLVRTAPTSWTLSQVNLDDGPYLPVNTTATTLTFASKTGTGVTVTASANVFVATDVGRTIRVFNGTPSVWGWARITAYTSATQVTVDIRQEVGATTATTTWRLGLWSATTGYPGVTALVEDRLAFGDGGPQPFSVHFSRTGDYENFAPTEIDGQVVDDNAISVNLVGGNGTTGRVDKVRWIVGDEKGVVVGTTGGEWLPRGTSSSAPITPSSTQVRQVTVIGSNDTKPVRAANAILMVQRASKKVREWAYAFDIDGFRATDLTLLAEHVTRAGVKEMAYQQEPYSIVWTVLQDGALASLTYDRNNEVSGWARHRLGGTDVEVISVAVIPSPDGTTDDVWFTVRRTIDGGTVQYTEYLEPFVSDLGSTVNAYFVDAGITYENATAFTTVSGLDHLEGETVTVLAGGATHPDKVVSSGQITLDRAVNKVAVGLNYVSKLETLRIEAGVDGTAQGKVKRVHKVVVRFYQTVHAKMGKRFNDLNTIFFRSSLDPMGEPLALFSGDKEEIFGGAYDLDGHICIQQDLPLPLTVLGMFPEMMTNA